MRDVRPGWPFISYPMSVLPTASSASPGPVTGDELEVPSSVAAPDYCGDLDPSAAAAMPMAATGNDDATTPTSNASPPMVCEGADEAAPPARRLEPQHGDEGVNEDRGAEAPVTAEARPSQEEEPDVTAPEVVAQCVDVVVRRRALAVALVIRASQGYISRGRDLPWRRRERCFTRRAAALTAICAVVAGEAVRSALRRSFVVLRRQQRRLRLEIDRFAAGHLERGALRRQWFAVRVPAVLRVMQPCGRGYIWRRRLGSTTRILCACMRGLQCRRWLGFQLVAKVKREERRAFEKLLDGRGWATYQAQRQRFLELTRELAELNGILDHQRLLDALSQSSSVSPPAAAQRVSPSPREEEERTRMEFRGQRRRSLSPVNREAVTTTQEVSSPHAVVSNFASPLHRRVAERHGRQQLNPPPMSLTAIIMGTSSVSSPQRDRTASSQMSRSAAPVKLPPLVTTTSSSSSPTTAATAARERSRLFMADLAHREWRAARIAARATGTISVDGESLMSTAELCDELARHIDETQRQNDRFRHRLALALAAFATHRGGGGAGGDTTNQAMRRQPRTPAISATADTRTEKSPPSSKGLLAPSAQRMQRHASLLPPIVSPGGGAIADSSPPIPNGAAAEFDEVAFASMARFYDREAIPTLTRQIDAQDKLVLELSTQLHALSTAAVEQEQQLVTTAGEEDSNAPPELSSNALRRRGDPIGANVRQPPRRRLSPTTEISPDSLIARLAKESKRRAESPDHATAAFAVGGKQLPVAPRGGVGTTTAASEAHFKMVLRSQHGLDDGTLEFATADLHRVRADHFSWECLLTQRSHDMAAKLLLIDKLLGPVSVAEPPSQPGQPSSPPPPPPAYDGEPPGAPREEPPVGDASTHGDSLSPPPRAGSTASTHVGKMKKQSTSSSSALVVAVDRRPSDHVAPRREYSWKADFERLHKTADSIVRLLGAALTTAKAQERKDAKLRACRQLLSPLPVGPSPSHVCGSPGE